MNAGRLDPFGATLSSFPLRRQIVVGRTVRGRYAPGDRPLSWDDRCEGVEEIHSSEDESFLLWSTGGQSTPASGWVLLLTGERELEDGRNASEWVLYGIQRAAQGMR